MKWFKNLKTSMKLSSAFIFIALLTAGVGLLGLDSLKKMNINLSGMYNNNVKSIQYVTDSSITFQRIRVNFRAIVMETDQAQIDDMADKIKKYKAQIEENIRQYKLTNMTEEEKVLLSRFPGIWDEYTNFIGQALELSNQGKNTEIVTLINGGFKDSGDKVSDLLDEMVSINVQLAEQRSLEGKHDFQYSQLLLFGIVVVVFVVAIVFGLMISRLISKPLHRAVDLVGKVANGDLTATEDYSAKDEIGQLVDSINGMILNLRSTVVRVMESAESVSTAAQQISASTEEVASGSADQAHAAQSINELFAELTTAMHSVAQIAEQAAELSGDTMRIAEKGGEVIHASLEGMDQINLQVIKLEEDSNKIGEIIDVIDDIAEQTNLLALNAAIEAARAGDQGRGFAVVADEVRKLAERSSEATKQITLIIKGMQQNTRNSVRAVEDGLTLSRRTGEAFEGIIGKVSESVDKVTEIAAASQQQAAQSSEVLAAVQSISAVTEEASASSEETASTAQSLAQLSDELNRIVSNFKVKS